MAQSSGDIDHSQRELLIRQQQATPKLHLMVPSGGNSNQSRSMGVSFWEEITSNQQSKVLDTSHQGAQHRSFIDQSIVEQLGSAQDFTNQIENPHYQQINTKINESIQNVSASQLDFTINGESMTSESLDDSSQQMIYPGMNGGPSSTHHALDRIPDELAESCYKCKSEFNFFFRRHHCEICRKVFCKNCSVQTVLQMDEEDQKRIRACKKCKEQHQKYIDTLLLQKSLISNKPSTDQLRAQSNHFSSILSHSKKSTPMNFNQDDVDPEYYINSYQQSQKQLTHGVDAAEYLRDTVTPMDDSDSSIYMDRHFSIDFAFNEHHLAGQLPKQANAVARLSATNKRAIQSYLREDERAISVTSNEGGSRGNRVTDQRTNEWLDSKLRGHLDAMIDEVIDKLGIEALKWRKILANCTKHAVMTIRPSSRMLADSIDFNSFIKIVTIQHHNQEKCQYINGVVFKKDVASRKMRTQIENPKILVLQNSLGYVQEEDGMADMQAEISQQDPFVKIIRQKIQSLKPDIIFIEKDASRLALQTMIEDHITVVTVTSAKMLKMIARSTQTIVCPSTNLLDKNFIVGQCLNFRVEQVKPIIAAGHNQSHLSLSESTSLMFLEGCQAKLGCSIVLSGPNQKELKQVRRALKICLKTARILLLEREMFRFFMPEIELFHSAANFGQESQVQEERKDKPSEGSTEPELTFQTAKDENANVLSLRTSSVTLERNSLASRTSDNDSKFADYESPYLYQKHMGRSQIVFEAFSLASSSKQENLLEEGPDYVVSSDKFDSKKAKSSFFDKASPEQTTQPGNRHSGDSDSSHTTGHMNSTRANSKSEVMNETNLRKKLKVMCRRPKRKIVPFLSEEEDMSLFTFLRLKAQNLAKPCQVKDVGEKEICGKPLMQHTDYLYHGNGSVEIKTSPVMSTQATHAKKHHIFETPTYLHCYCRECKRVVMTKERVPDDMLEMSFNKLLEMFFYNQRISISNRRDSDHLAGEPICPHSLFRCCELVFRFGPVKTTIRYEQQDPYTLDMYHFGLQKGTITDSEIQAQLEMRLESLQSNMKGTYRFILSKLELLISFMDVGFEEVKHTIGAIEQEWLSGTRSQLMTFLNQQKKTCTMFYVFAMKYVFGEEIDKANVLQASELSEISEEQAQRTPRKEHKAQEIKSLMQFNRLHKILAARACEFLFILRRSVSLIMNDLTAIIWPKKQLNPFAEVDSMVNQSINLANSQVKNEIERQMMALTGLDASILMAARTSSLPKVSQFRNEGEGSRDSQVSGQAPNAKALYKEMALFERQVLDCQFIADLVEQNVFIPPGFNQNATELVKLGSGPGQKKIIDLASLIASALSSNLYLNGLAYLDYLNMPAYINPYNGQFSSNADGGSIQRELDIAAATGIDNQSDVQLSQDVLNNTMKLGLVEEELLSNPSNAFKISFSTSQPLANLEVLVDEQKRKQFVHGYDETKQFYSPCEEIANLKQIEVPLAQHVFQDLIQLHYLIIPASGQSRANSLKKRSVSSEDMPRASSINLGTSNRQSGGKDWAKALTHEAAYREIYHLFHEKIDYFVKVYCPKQFEALRKLYCGPYNEFLHSVFRSDLWTDNSGGKSCSTFFKSFDNKYVLKAVEQKEIKMFNDMSHSYFEYLSRSFTQQCPTAIAKTLGIFRITMKRGKHTQHHCVLLMENVLLNVDEEVSIKYDLKGSKRNRYIPGTKQQAVTLDNNFLYDRKSRPIPMQYSMKRLLKIAIANDSLYLTKHSIIDYSMFVIINPVKRTVRTGIIDYIQQYTLEKELESYLKQTIAKEDPTIIPPADYKRRFRTAMDKYFIAMVPDQEQKMNKIMIKNFEADQIEWPTKLNTETTMMLAVRSKIASLLKVKTQEEAIEVKQ